MPEIIHCPGCQRKLQVPEELLGSDVQCPTCKQTFVAAVGASALPAPPPPLPAEPARPAYDLAPAPDEPRPMRRSRRDYDDEDYDDEDDDFRHRRRDLAPHRGGAVLTLGIGSLVCTLGTLFCLASPLIGLVLGIVSWVLGQQDLAAIRAGRMDPTGRGTVNGGRVCGIIGTILNALVVVGGVLLLVVLFGVAAADRGRRW
jgi:hypothetical protein